MAVPELINFVRKAQNKYLEGLVSASPVLCYVCAIKTSWGGIKEKNLIELL